MATEKTERGVGGDEGTISIAQAYELNYWCKRFGTSPELLREAICEVGNRLEDLQGFFRKSPVRR